MLEKTFYTRFKTAKPILTDDFNFSYGARNIKGMTTVSGHFVYRAWGKFGACYCGHTVDFDNDPATSARYHPFASCCKNAINRIRNKYNNVIKANREVID